MFDLQLSNLAYFEPTFGEFHIFWIHICRTSFMLDVHLSNFTCFGLTFVELHLLLVYQRWKMTDFLLGSRPDHPDRSIPSYAPKVFRIPHIPQYTSKYIQILPNTSIYLQISNIRNMRANMKPKNDNFSGPKPFPKGRI